MKVLEIALAVLAGMCVSIFFGVIWFLDWITRASRPYLD